MKKLLLAFVSLYVVPMAVLLLPIAVFQVASPFSIRHGTIIRDIIGHGPIYERFLHAIMSLRLIALLGLILMSIVIPFRIFRDGSSTFHAFQAAIVGFCSSFGLLYLNWVHIDPGAHVPFAPTLLRSIGFAVIYTLTAHITKRIASKMMMNN